MKFSNLYIAAIVFGIIGTLGGAFAGGIIAAAACDVSLECLGTAFLGVGLEAILAESCLMALAVHNFNNGRGNLLLTFLPTLVLAVAIIYALMMGFTAPLAVLFFLLQAWVCVKVQLTTGRRTRASHRARSGSR